MKVAWRIENGGTNCPNCAAPSSTIWIAPDDADSMTSRDEPSCPAGKVWMSTAPPVSSRTCLATRSIIATDGWLVGSTVAQRSVVAARARTGKAQIAALASPAPIHSRRVQRIGLLIAPPLLSIKSESRSLDHLVRLSSSDCGMSRVAVEKRYAVAPRGSRYAFDSR